MQKAIQEAKKMIEESINDKTRTGVHIEVQVLEKLIERLEKLPEDELNECEQDYESIEKEFNDINNSTEDDGWISVCDNKKPEYSKRVIAIDKNWNNWSIVHLEERNPGTWYDDNGYEKKYVTHWKPLPKPPTTNQ